MRVLLLNIVLNPQLSKFFHIDLYDFFLLFSEVRLLNLHFQQISQTPSGFQLDLRLIPLHQSY